MKEILLTHTEDCIIGRRLNAFATEPLGPCICGVDEAFAEIKRLKRERDEAQDRNECVVCMERPRAVVFLPCEHCAVCASCAAALQECPNCRATITTRITIANSS